MFICARNLTRLFAAITCLACLTATVAAQENASPTENVKAVEDAKKEAATSPPSTQEPKISLDGTVPEFSTWTKGLLPSEFRKWGQTEYKFPAITEPCATIDEAKLQLDGALEKAVTGFLLARFGNSETSRRLTPPAATIRNLYLVKDIPEIEKQEKDGVTTYRAALQVRVKESELVQWTERDQLQRQGNAVFRTLYVGGGLLGVVAILALSARLNHATSGKRSGILRAASTLAILCLLVGLFITAVLGRVFTS